MTRPSPVRVRHGGLRILMVSDVYFPRVNGVSTSIQTYRQDLRALGHHCTLIVPEYAGSAPLDDVDMIRVASRPVPRDPEDRLLSRRALRALLPTLQRDEYDVVHIQTPFVAHYAGIEFGRALGIPIVETYHTYFEHYLSHYVPALPAALPRYLARRFTVTQCGQVDVVISPSRPMAEALRAYGVTTPIEILPTGLPPDRFERGVRARFRLAQGIEASRPVALFVGRVAHEKNIDFLLDMLPELRERVPNVLLVIAGEGPASAHCRQRVAALGLVGHVHFVGYLSRDRDLLDCYSAADVFVFASRTETQGLVLLEALAQGTPVVSTAVMGTAEVLEGARGARVVVEDRVLVATAVADLLRSADARGALAGAARADAARWSSRAMAERLVALYERVSGLRPPVRSATVGDSHLATGAQGQVA